MQAQTAHNIMIMLTKVFHGKKHQERSCILMTSSLLVLLLVLFQLLVLVSHPFMLLLLPCNEAH